MVNAGWVNPWSGNHSPICSGAAGAPFGGDSLSESEESSPEEFPYLVAGLAQLSGKRITRATISYHYTKDKLILLIMILTSTGLEGLPSLDLAILFTFISHGGVWQSSD